MVKPITRSLIDYEWIYYFDEIMYLQYGLENKHII